MIRRVIRRLSSRIRGRNYPLLFLSLLLGFLILLLLLLAACSPPAASVAPTFVPPPTAGPPPGSTQPVIYGSVTETVETRGRVAAKREAQLFFSTGGTLRAVHVASGDRVEEGALLAELDAPEAETRITQAQYALESAETELELAELQLSLIGTTESSPGVLSAQIALQKAAAELARANEEYDKAIHRDWEPPEVAEAYAWTLQLAEWEYQLAEAKLSEAQHALSVRRTIQGLKVEQARRSVERAQEQVMAASEQISNTQITAPFSGMIVSVEKQAGSQVGPYEPLGVIADSSELWIVATVLEEEANIIAVGRPATVRLDAYPDRTYSGIVLQIAGQTVVWQGQSAYEVTLAFDEDQDVPATIRMGADVTIAGRSKMDVLVVPSKAIMTIGGQRYVEIVGQDGEAERVEIETGISDGDTVEVVAGLEAGQEIRIP